MEQVACEPHPRAVGLALGAAAAPGTVRHIWRHFQLSRLGVVAAGIQRVGARDAAKPPRVTGRPPPEKMTGLKCP